MSIDVFVHFEPRLVYHHLRQLARLLKEGGIGIIHHANTLSEIGFRQFLLTSTKTWSSGQDSAHSAPCVPS